MPKYAVYRKLGQAQELAEVVTAADPQAAAQMVAANSERAGKYVVFPAASATIIEVEVQRQYQTVVVPE
jgi:hypothetical protein